MIGRLPDCRGNMNTAAILALATKPAHTWTLDEELAAKELLHGTPEPLPERHVSLLFAVGEAEDARLRREGATDLDD